MKSLYLNGGGAAVGTAAKTAGKAGGGLAGAIDPITAAAEALGKIGIGIADASKRRQMDFSLNQQRIQAELGIAEKSAQQQYDLAKLNLLAQSVGAKPKEEKNIAKTIAIVTLSLVGIGTLGVFVYLITRR